MRDGAQMEEVSGAVGIGLLAADVVGAVGRLTRGAALREGDKAYLGAAKSLLEALISPSTGAAPPAGLRLLAASGSGLEALSAVELKAANTDVTEFLSPLASALESAISNPDDVDHEALLIVRDLFSAISDAEVSHVSRLSRPHAQSVPLWSAAIPSSGF